MQSRLSSFVERQKNGFLMLPMLGLLAALVGATSVVWLDRRLEMTWLADVMTDDAEVAKTALSVVATSMLSLTVLVFTITIVVLQLAASQYSPRITRTFLRHRKTKLALGLFLGTFAYALVVLLAVETSPPSFVPALALGGACLLVLASLIMFIAFLDHIAQAIRVSNIARGIARDGIDIYEAFEAYEEPRSRELPIAEADHRTTRFIEWDREAGVLSHVDEEGLAEVAEKLGAVIVVKHAIGDFVPHGAMLMELRGAADQDLTADEIFNHVNIGPDRTPQQDLGLPIRHLIDLALRALSPGVNDPTTAVQAIDYVHDLLRRLVRSALPAREIRDADDQVRLILARPSWDALVALAVTELRGVGAHQIQVSRRVMYMLDDLLSIAPEGRRQALLEERRKWMIDTRRELSQTADQHAARLPDAQGISVSESVERRGDRAWAMGDVRSIR